MSIQQENELKLFRKSIQAFAKKELEPHYLEWEREGNIPREIWRKLGDEGFLCVDIPAEYGGLGAPFIFSATIVEEFYRLGFSSIATNISVHSNILSHYLLSFGTEEQKQFYLPKMATGELVSAIAMSEPNAGSDLQGIQSYAQYDEQKEQYILNGTKTFITNGQHCDFVIVAARTDLSVQASKGTTLFIVDIPSEGFQRGKKLDKIGLLSCDTSEMFLEDVAVSQTAILGKLNEGFKILMKELPRERLTLGIGAIGAIDGMLAWTKQYVTERFAFGKPLSHLQNTRFKMAEMYTQFKVHRAFVNECIELLEKGELDTETASMAKLACSEVQGKIADECLQLFGGYGYMREYPIARAFVDARVQRIYGGTSEIMKEIISRGIFGR